ncbi:MAG: YcxB family protein [Pirellula sp.]|jgi:hypothetical protein|nr:YcxB family protein [Pirellula sp.]
MKLTFTLSEPEALAMTEQFYRDSASHQKTRNQTRWGLPILLLPILLLFTWQFGFSLPSVAIFLIAMIGWFIVAPHRFDARVRRYAIKQMKESSYAKSFGEYSIQINDDHLVSDGPTGHTEYKWNGVDRSILTDEYLFVFLAGPSGFPIKTSDVGSENARLAHIRIQQLIEMAK